jgi:hypothetical protein
MKKNRLFISIFEREESGVDDAWHGRAEVHDETRRPAGDFDDDDTLLAAEQKLATRNLLEVVYEKEPALHFNLRFSGDRVSELRSEV